MHACTYACMHACTYVCTHARMYACKHSTYTVVRSVLVCRSFFSACPTGPLRKSRRNFYAITSLVQHGYWALKIEAPSKPKLLTMSKSNRSNRDLPCRSFGSPAEVRRSCCRALLSRRNSLCLDPPGESKSQAAVILQGERPCTGKSLIKGNPL